MTPRTPLDFFRPVLFGALITFGHAAAAPGEDAQYREKLENRVESIVTSLQLGNAAKQGHVHDALLAQYRELNQWHNAHDAELKSLGKAAAPGDAAARDKLAAIHASLQSVHEQFLARLANDLTPEQIEAVKDRMTYNKVKVTYDAYCQIVPNLTETDKARILALLKEAREDAIDGGSAEEKSAVFGKYKGKINNYLSSTGHDVKQAYKDWGAKQRAKHDTSDTASNSDAK